MAIYDVYPYEIEYERVIVTTSDGEKYILIKHIN